MPADFEGTVAGKCKLSPLLAERSKCVLYDAGEPHKIRYTVTSATTAARKALSGQAGDEAAFSSITNVPQPLHQNGGVSDNGSVFICFPDEYTDEQREMDTKEGQNEIRMATRAAPIRFLGFTRRIFCRYGSSCDQFVYCLAVAILLFLCVGIPLIVTFTGKSDKKKT